MLEVVALTGLGETNVRAEIAAGRLKVVRIGRAILVPRVELDAWIVRETARSAVSPLESGRDVLLLRVLADARWVSAMAKETDTKLRQLIAAREA